MNCIPQNTQKPKAPIGLSFAATGSLHVQLLYQAHRMVVRRYSVAVQAQATPFAGLVAGPVPQLDVLTVLVLFQFVTATPICTAIEIVAKLPVFLFFGIGSDIVGNIFQPFGFG